MVGFLYNYFKERIPLKDLFMKVYPSYLEVKDYSFKFNVDWPKIEVVIYPPEGTEASFENHFKIIISRDFQGGNSGTCNGHLLFQSFQKLDKMGYSFKGQFLDNNREKCINTILGDIILPLLSFPRGKNLESSVN